MDEEEDVVDRRYTGRMCESTHAREIDRVGRLVDSNYIRSWVFSRSARSFLLIVLVGIGSCRAESLSLLQTGSCVEFPRYSRRASLGLWGWLARFFSTAQ